MRLIRKGNKASCKARPVLRAVVAALATIGAAGWMAPAAANVGIDVMVQNWDPSLPEPDALVSVMSHSGRIGDDVLAFINRSKPAICEAVKRDLGKSEALAKGVTLRNIECTLGTLSPVTARQTGPWSFELAVVLAGNRLKADSTQPTVAGAWADPSLSVTFDINTRILVQVGNSPLMSVVDSHVDLANVNARPENFISEVYTRVLEAFGLKGFALQLLEAAVEDGINGGGVLARVIAAPLQQAQQLLPPQRVYSLKGFKLSANKLRFAFVPQQFALKPASGVVDGLVRYPEDMKLVQGCSAFRITARAQVKPREFRGFDVPFGPAEMVEASSRFVPQPLERSAGYQVCQYQISGLPEGTYTRMSAAVPNLIAANTSQSSGAPLFFNVPMLAPQGFRDFVVPRPRAVANYEVRTQRIPGAPLAQKQQLRADPPVGPQVGQPKAAPVISTPQPLQPAIRPGSAVRINVATFPVQPRLPIR